MKKKYTKPMIIIEDFSLNTTIAGTCEHKTNTLGYGDCGLDFSGVRVFFDGMSYCEGGILVDNVGGDGEYNGICYHVPVDTSTMFNS